jgi:uncharacterized membrane protein
LKGYSSLLSKDRLEAFSDGVFAVALTLLILEIHVPEIPHHSGNYQYVLAMVPLIPKFLTFVLTFILISTYWVSHHYFFFHLNGITIGFTWLNNLFLLWICLLPFPTAMLGEHPTDQFPILQYSVASLLAALTFLSLRVWAKYNGLFKNREAIKTMGPRHSIPSVTIFSLSIVFSFINVYFSLACFLLVPVLYFIPNLDQFLFYRTKRNKEHYGNGEQAN